MGEGSVGPENRAPPQIRTPQIKLLILNTTLIICHYIVSCDIMALMHVKGGDFPTEGY